VGLLGVFWGVMYIKRRSAMLSIANHASFNAVQVVQALLAKSFGS
jgi:membrane protease YdiL (CAAX protease family)